MAIKPINDRAMIIFKSKRKKSKYFANQVTTAEVSPIWIPPATPSEKRSREPPS